MKSQILTLSFAIGAIGAMALAGTTDAFANAAEDKMLLEKADLTLRDAIEKAEAHQNGEAVDAEIDNEKGVTVFEVTVLSGDTLYDIVIDAKSGDVIRSAPEKK